MVNSKAKLHTYDSIVIGSGISGGWAAMELCKKGLKTLLLERGRNVEHVRDYPTASLHPWNFEYRHLSTTKNREESPVSTGFADDRSSHFFANEKEHPYIQEQPFAWVRGYQVGGRSLTWGRQCYRWSDMNFGANKKDGTGIDWPIRYRDLEKWYDYVETHIGVSGKSENLPQLPDGKFLPPMELNCIEKHLAESIKKNDERRILTIARVANLTRGWDGRGHCRNRNECQRGCPWGGYFSSNSSTIPAAMATGNLTIRPFSIVSEVIYDDTLQKATGVRIIDAHTNEVIEFYAKIIFLNASTIATASILLNSVSQRFPNGLGNDSGQLGHNLMDHHIAAGAYGIHEGFEQFYYKGRRPCGFIIPNFMGLAGSEDPGFLRGYGIQGRGSRQEWEDISRTTPGFGIDFKKQLTNPGPWSVWMGGWGECLPYYENMISLSETQKDSWGLPLVKIDFSLKDNEHRMREHIVASCGNMLEEAGFRNIELFNDPERANAIHEMGTARMGIDPQTSVLNSHNQIHAVKNVFITDGSCMTSSACQNPSLTYMALTARACDYAVDKLVKGDL